MQAISIARTGLTAATARLNASASNVANAETNGRIPSTPASQAIATTGDASSRPAVYQAIRTTQSSTAAGGVQVGTAAVLPSYVQVYDPSAPYADSRGMVAAPNVDLINERIEQIAAKQAYEANLKVLKTADEMQRRLTDLSA